LFIFADALHLDNLVFSLNQSVSLSVSQLRCYGHL